MNLPTTFAEAERFRESSRTRKLGNNTVLRWSEDEPGRERDWYAIRLHDTDVVTFYADGTIQLDSGGWKTVTTKDRMNKILQPNGYTLYQQDFEWFITRLPFSHNEPSPYYDGMVLQLEDNN